MNKIFDISKLKRQKGFMLIEISFAIVIISVALVIISTMFTKTIQANTVAKDYTVAANLAQKQLELLKTQPPEYWSGLTLPCTIAWQDDTQSPLPQYRLITHANSYAANHDLVQVTVTASWQERNIDCNLEFVTLYSTL